MKSAAGGEQKFLSSIKRKFDANISAKSVWSSRMKRYANAGNAGFSSSKKIERAQRHRARQPMPPHL
jgi:hypothetical protein